MRKALSGAVVAILTLAGLAPAQTKPATLEGDVYVVTKSGDTKRGAGRTVFLLRDDGLRDTLRAVCVRALDSQLSLTKWRAALNDTERMVRAGTDRTDDIYQVLNREQRVEKGISAWRDDARRSILSTIAKSIVDSIGTGMNAHYRFSVKRPGSYYLFSDWDMGDNRYIWLAPVSLSSKPLTRDLDNSVIVDRGAVCL